MRFYMLLIEEISCWQTRIATHSTTEVGSVNSLSRDIAQRALSIGDYSVVEDPCSILQQLTSESVIVGYFPVSSIQ